MTSMTGRMNGRIAWIALATALFLGEARGEQERAPATRPAGRPGGRTIYTNDFEKQAGPEWSDQSIELSPNGKRRFLGQFGNQAVSLALESLPEHAYVRLSFDLYVIRTWDGSKPPSPDIWSLAVDGGPTLLHATPQNSWEHQSYPDDYPGPMYRGGTGAAETDTLGYSYKNAPAHDATFRMHFAFPHATDSIRLILKGSQLQGLDDESWGVDNVTVEVLSDSPGRNLTDAELRRFSRKLADEGPMAAHKAVWALIGAGDRAIPHLRALLQGADSLDPKRAKRVKQLIAELDDESWETREKATQELIRLGGGIEPLLRKALADT